MILNLSLYSQSYIINEDAINYGVNGYRLTTDEDFKLGTVWYEELIDLNKSFDIQFKANFGTHSESQDVGADGIMFVLQRDADGTNSVGNTGREMAYGGLTPSLGIEFDTRDDGEGYESSHNGTSWNGEYDHIAITKNGDITDPYIGIDPTYSTAPATPANVATEIEDGQDHIIRIKWDATTHFIKIYFDCDLRVDYEIDIVTDIFGGSSLVYWGCTAATGDESNEQIVYLEDNIITDDTLMVCEGDSVQLFATGSQDDTYTWSANYNINDITSQNPYVHPNLDTTYYVNYNDFCGDSRTDSTTVLVYEKPIFDLGNDTSFCSAESIDIDAGNATYTYEWSHGGNAQTETISAGNTYIVTATNTDNCSSTDTIVISEIPSPNISAGNDVGVCLGTTVTLTATGGTSYVWSTLETNPSISVSPTTTSTYTVSTTENGCTDSDTVIVTISSNLDIDIGSDTTICIGDSIQLTASAGVNFAWSTGATSQSIYVVPNVQNSYSVIADDGGSCSGKDTILIDINQLPNANAGDNVVVCSGGTLDLTATGGISYVWSTSDTVSTISVSPASNTTYIVTVTDNNNCSDTAQVLVTIGGNLIANAGNDTTICAGETLTLTASGGNNYSWNTGDLSENIVVSPNSTYSYIVSVSDANGNCEDIDTIEVSVNNLPIVNAGEDEEICRGETISLTSSIGASYLWDNGDTTRTINITPIIDKAYSVTVTDINFCSSADTVLVFINNLPNANAGQDKNICLGESVTLTATGGATYVWDNGVENGVSFTPTHSGITTYTVTVTSAGNCSSTDNVSITVHMPPSVNVGSDIILCSGDTAQIGTTATTGYSYSWSPTTGIENSNQSSTNISLSSILSVTKQYTLTATDISSGCTASDEIEISISPELHLNANITKEPLGTICVGQEVDFEVLGDNFGTNPIFNWTINNLSVGNNSPNYSTNSLSNNDDISCTITSSISQCLDINKISTSINIDVYPNLDFNLTSLKDTICEGDTITIFPNAVGGNGAYTFTLNGNVINMPYTTIPTEDTKYNITLTDNCSSEIISDTINISTIYFPEAGFTSSALFGCLPLTVSFVDYYNTDIYSYNWEIGNSPVITERYPTYTFTEEGNYDVSLTVSAGGCSRTNTATEMISVYSNPEARFSTDIISTDIFHSNIDFDNTSVNAQHFTWDFGDGDSSIVTNPNHTYRDAGTFNITLLAESGNGCKDTISEKIFVKEKITLYAPTAFMPGFYRNNLFCPIGYGIDPNSFNLLIFDRWGSKIYEIDKYDVSPDGTINNGWDGTINGKKAPIGVYVWIASYKGSLTGLRKETGTITIIK